MKKRTMIFLIALLIFLLMLIAKFIVEYNNFSATSGAGPFAGNLNDIAYNQMEQSYSGTSQTRKNYASAKMAIPQPGISAQTVEQKYERVSTINTSSQDWDRDTASIKSIIAESNALVQAENSTGLPGNRRLNLELGVIPETFDQTVERLRAVGKLESISVTKTDRTADFRALEAKRLSLEKTRAGLAALRNSGAELKDRIDLESRILEIEGQIQDLGVSLGDFSETNSFCTIKINLYETSQVAKPGMILLSAFLSALSWTVAVYLGIALCIVAVLGIATLGLKVWEFIRSKMRKES